MRGRLYPVLLALVILTSLPACAPPSTAGREPVDDDLRVVALRADDIGNGYAPEHEGFRTNEELAGDFTESDTVHRLLDETGRLAGYSNMFVAGEPPDKPRQPVAVASGVERYADAGRAAAAVKGRNEINQYAKEPAQSLTAFAVTPLADECVGDRALFSLNGMTNLIGYAVTLRRGTVVISVTTFATADKDDRGNHAIRYAKLLLERLSVQLQP
jgi:hypothetical protein